MKNNILILFATMLLSVVITEAEAQNIDREVTIEKEYTPEVDAAVKKTGIPQAENPLVEKPVNEYSTWAVPLSGNPTSQPLLVSELKSEESFINQRGYANFGMGNNLNINADAGIRIINTKRNQLGVWYNHTSTGGHLKYKDNVPVYGGEKVYQHLNSNVVNATYKHAFDKLEWTTSFAYKHNKFNYYGAKLTPNIPTISDTDYQKVNQYAGGTSFRSTKNKDVTINASVGFTGYYNNIGYMIGEEGGRENHLTANLEVAARLGSNNNRLGFEFDMNNLFYNDAAEADNYTMLTLTPFYKFTNEKIRLKVGARMDISVNDGTVFRFAPDFEFNADMGKYFHFYTVVDGGKEINSWSKMSARNIYINPTKQLNNTYTAANAVMGLLFDYIPGVQLRVYGGIKTSTNALFDMRYKESITDGMIASYEVIDYTPIDAYRWLGGANINFKLKKILEGEVKWTLNNWRSRSGEGTILSALPKNEWNIKVGVNPIKNLSINANFYMGIGRGYRYQNSLGMDVFEKMGDIYDLSLSANYSLTKLISFNLQWNNILSQNYDIYYGMPAQRMNFLLGAAVKF
ncbi:MAG: hypothetical protein IKB57_00310 [Bacteroidaceae bacterium]|nr:hypothetical protein [Bacteroidaceae bacterium]